MDLSKNEFLALVLLYASRVDMEVSMPEEKFIIQEVGQDAYDRIRGLFDDMSDFEIIQTISNLRERFFPGSSGKSQMVNEIARLFDADGKFTGMERVVLHSLDRLL